MARTFQRDSKKSASGSAKLKVPGVTKPTSKKLKLPSRSKKRGAKRSYRKKDTLRTRILRWVGILLLVLAAALVAFGVGGYWGLVRSVDQLQEPAAVSTSPTYIYSAPLGDTNGSRRVIGTSFRSENRQQASLSQMPQELLDALVAKEDERFREHAGVDLWGIVRALYVDLRAGARVEGASTITQQYVKNAYLYHDQTIARKLKEALIAVEVERRLEKDEILAKYLNTVYFGNNAYGAAAAAETYFNKSVEDLSLAESATLIGLLWSPSNLGTDAESARQQRNLVLRQMAGAGYISQQDRIDAMGEQMPENWPMAPMLETGLTGLDLSRDFADYVQEQLVEEYGAATVEGGGLSVYTTLDLGMQRTAREMLYGPSGYLPDPENPDVALVSIEPDTGHVKTMVGNRDPEAHFNLATQARRQPGSSFKPFALIAALEQGIEPDTRFVSEDKTYRVRDAEGNLERWQVENFDEAERGPMTLEEALWVSDNTVFTDLVTNAGGRGLEDGAAQVVDVARRLGVSADFGDHPHPSVVLGTQEVSPMDMAVAYATIANEGRRVEPVAVTQVVRNEGQEDEEVLQKTPRSQGEQVIEPEVAEEITEIMVGDVERGVADRASLGDRPAAGKTGTTENFFDSWFVGFTPQMTTAVWMGYAEGGKTLRGLLDLGGDYTGPLDPSSAIWGNYTQQILRGEPVEGFDGVDLSRYGFSSDGGREGTNPATTPAAPGAAPGSGSDPAAPSGAPPATPAVPPAVDSATDPTAVPQAVPQDPAVVDPAAPPGVPVDPAVNP